MVLMTMHLVEELMEFFFKFLGNLKVPSLTLVFQGVDSGGSLLSDE